MVTNLLHHGGKGMVKSSSTVCLERGFPHSRKRRMKMKSVYQKSLALALTAALTLGAGSTAMASASPSDIKGHWAEQTLQEWVSKDYLNGYPDGTIRPNNDVKRGEFAALLNKAFQITEGTIVTFSDLNKEQWEYDSISAAVQAGYLKGYEDGTVRVKQPVTRQEAAAMLAGALGSVTEGMSQETNKFEDSASIAEWCKAAVGALSAKGIFSGYGDGSFKPKANLTRAEAVTILNKAMSLKTAVYDKAGTFGPEKGTETLKGDVVVKAAGITLKNVVIEGNLLLDKGIGNGDVTLDHVQVKGKTIVQGGGENSVHFKDSVILTVIVDKKDGTVRIVAEGLTSVQSVTVQSSARIEENGITGGGFSTIDLAKELPADSKVTLKGAFENVNIYAAKIEVKIPEGSIQNLNLDKVAENSSIEIAQSASILNLVLDSAAKITGQGTVTNATVNEGAKGSSFETKPVNTDGQAKDTVVVQPAPSSSSGAVSGGTTGGDTPSGGTDTQKSDVADLDSITLSGLTLLQLDNNRQLLPSTGFNRDVTNYYAVLPGGFTEQDITVAIQKTDNDEFVNASVYSPMEGAAANLYYSFQDKNAFTYVQKPKTPVEMYIEITSESKKTNKYYRIYISYEKSIEERVSVTANGSVKVGGVLGGDEVFLYDSKEAGSPLASRKLEWWNDYVELYVPELDQNSHPDLASKGSLWVAIKKKGETLEGERQEYNYNREDILQSELNADKFTVSEVSDRDKESFAAYNPDYLSDETYAVATSLDISGLADVAFVRTQYYQGDYLPTTEDAKITVTDQGLTVPYNGVINSNHFWSNPLTTPPTETVIYYLYGSDRQLIGYIKKTYEFFYWDISTAE